MLHSHYTKPGTPENSTADNRTPFIPSPSEDRKISSDKGKDDDEDENYDERAPFIPLSTVDSELDGDALLVEIPFIDSPMTPSPSSWLLDVDESMPSPGGPSISMAAPSSMRPIPYKRPPSFSASSSPVMSRKEVPSAVKRNGYITNEMTSRGKGFFPNISSWDAEVNAPVQHSGLLQGEELLRALECGDSYEL